MSTATETTLALHVEQILEGEATCAYCDADAMWMLGTGTDPAPEPQCHAHASEFVAMLAGKMREWAK